MNAVPEDRARQIAEIEEALRQLLPETTRRALEAQLAHLRAALTSGVDLSQRQVGEVAIGGRAAPMVNVGPDRPAIDDSNPDLSALPPPMVPIAGGSFQIGITEAEHRRIVEQERANNLADGAQRWYERALNHQAVAVAPFALARFPVTTVHYQRFIDATGYNREAPWWSETARDWLRKHEQVADGPPTEPKGKPRDRPELWEHPLFGRSRPHHPVVGITWYEAMAFCAWATLHLDDGHVYRLPSEAEWELAARGSERRMYPWGDAPPDRERANYGNVSAGTSAVGSFPAGATPDTGLLDLAGNIWEWTRSEYRPYPYDPADGREDASSPGQKPFTLRGGAWINRPIYLRATFRRGSPPELYNQFIGFRLARHRA